MGLTAIFDGLTAAVVHLLGFVRGFGKMVRISSTTMGKDFLSIYYITKKDANNCHGDKHRAEALPPSKLYGVFLVTPLKPNGVTGLVTLRGLNNLCYSFLQVTHKRITPKSTPTRLSF